MDNNYSILPPLHHSIKCHHVSMMWICEKNRLCSVFLFGWKPGSVVIFYSLYTHTALLIKGCNLTVTLMDAKKKSGSTINGSVSASTASALLLILFFSSFFLHLFLSVLSAAAPWTHFFNLTVHSNEAFVKYTLQNSVNSSLTEFSVSEFINSLYIQFIN